MQAGHAVVSQLVPVPDAVLKVPGRNSSATYELVFLAQDIPPLGFLQFHVQRTANLRFQKEQMSQILRPERSHKDIEVNLGVSRSRFVEEGRPVTILVETVAPKNYTGMITYLIVDRCKFYTILIYWPMLHGKIGFIMTLSKLM